MRVFVDTNVLLDVLARREPFYRESVQIWSLAERGQIVGLVSVISFTNLFYMVSKLRSARAARRMLALLRDTFVPVACDQQVLSQAIDAEFKDLEDAVQYFSAIRADASCIVSRNPGHFPKSSLPVLSPAEFLAAYSFDADR